MQDFDEKKLQKKYFSIGETAKICGISVQTLRFYSKIDLISPAYTSEETGYRYYLPEQFQLIDRAKYLQKFGFSLQDIQKIFREGNADYLRSRLVAQREKLQAQEQELQEILKEISWYCNYFRPIAPSAFPQIPFRQHYEERYVLLESGGRYETTHEIYRRLIRRRNEPEYQDLRWRFHFCYPLDFDDFCNNIYTQLGSGVFLAEKPERELPHVKVLPEGEYLCILARLHKNDWDASFLKALLKGHHAPEFVFASELEDHVSDFSNSQFIVQFYINDLSPV